MVLEITSDNQHQVVSRDAVREPQLLKLAGGDLLLTYHVQPDVHFAERHGLRSRDGGQTWQDEPRRAHREQAIGQGADGTVLAPDIYTFEREPGVYVGSYYRSEDGGATFTGPHETVVHVNRVLAREYPTPEHYPPEDHALHKFYQPLPSYYEPTVASASWRQGPTFWRYMIEHEGRWLAPIQCRFHADRHHRTILVASENGGRTWDFVSTIAYEHGDPGDGHCEPALITVPDGSLLCMLRRGGGLQLAQCRSTDGGATWTEPELLAGHGVDPDLYLMSNGALACTFGRPGLHIMFSEDGCGYSWGYRQVLGTWRSSTYMGIAEVAPDELLVTYDCSESDVGGSREPEKCYVGSTKLRVTRK